MADVVLSRFESSSFAAIDLSGNATTLVSTNTYYIPNSDGRTNIWVHGTGTVSITVDYTVTVGGQAVTDKSYSVDNTWHRVIPRSSLVPHHVNDAQGRIKLTVNADSLVSITAFLV